VILAHATASGTDRSEVPIAQWRHVAPVAAAAEFIALGARLADDLRRGASAVASAVGEGTAYQVALATPGLALAALNHPQAPTSRREAIISLLADAQVEMAAMRTNMLSGQQGTNIDQLMRESSTSARIGALCVESGVILGTNDRSPGERTDLRQAGATLGQAAAVLDWLNASSLPLAVAGERISRSSPSQPLPDYERQFAAARGREWQRASQALTRLGEILEKPASWLSWIIATDQ
jgi:hypothetical protein